MAEEATTLTTTINMEIENTLNKRSHDEEHSQNGTESKKQKIDIDGDEEEEKSSEEKWVEEKSESVELGPKKFVTSVEMFDYFFHMLHHWPQNLRLNTYEHMVMLELINKGHPEPEKKIGEGAEAFQIRVHPEFQNKCFFILRKDESVEDFSFRKCIDKILPLPENMRVGDRDSSHRGGRGRRGGGGGGGGGRRGGGRGRGGNFRGGRGRGGKRN